MDAWILGLIEQGGYIGIVFLMALENVFPPIPSELIMGLGGMAVARGTMQFWPLLVAGTVGATVGNYFWYWIGDTFGYRRLRPFIDRWGRWLTLEWHDVEKASAFFRRHGHWVIFALRCSPLLRTIISLPAGLTHMPRFKFFLYTAAGSLVWNAALIIGGHWLADTFADVQGVLGWMIIATLAISVAAYGWRVATWKPREPLGESDA
jgi:membrane protein DedA with SNARE-associated domain